MRNRCTSTSSHAFWPAETARLAHVVMVSIVRLVLMGISCARMFATTAASANQGAARRYMGHLIAFARRDSSVDFDKVLDFLTKAKALGATTVEVDGEKVKVEFMPDFGADAPEVKKILTSAERAAIRLANGGSDGSDP